MMNPITWKFLIDIPAMNQSASFSCLFSTTNPDVIGSEYVSLFAQRVDVYIQKEWFLHFGGSKMHKKAIFSHGRTCYLVSREGRP